MSASTSIKVAVATLCVATAALAYVWTRPPVQAGYFYRQIVRISYAGEPLEFTVVIACDRTLVKKFGAGATFTGSAFYAERVRGNHAIGLRPTAGCSGHTTDNGGAPADLFPLLHWFPDADDMSFSILYATEDAFENPLAQFQFLGSTMHVATAADYERFVISAHEKSLYPFDYEAGFEPTGRFKRPTVAQVVADNGKLPRPNFIHGWCQAVHRKVFSEKAREVVRDFWPAHRPQFWTLGHDRSREFDQAILDRVRNKNEAVQINGGTIATGKWSVYLPNDDSLPTKAGGGMLEFKDGPNKFTRRTPGSRFAVLDTFPVIATDKFAFYDIADKDKDDVTYKIDLRGGATKGFAYCGPRIFGVVLPRSAMIAALLPGLEDRKVNLFVGDGLVDTSAARPPIRGATVPSFFAFERDEVLFEMQNYH